MNLLLRGALLLLLAAALLSAGCTPSGIYSPSVNLPPEPLKQKQVQVFAGVVEMPEVRPQKMPEKTARGIEATARLGATDWLTLQTKFWQDLSDNFSRETRYGVSVSTILAHTRDFGGTRIGVMPTAVFLCDEDEWLGVGGTLPLCAWLPDFSVLHPYAAIGPGMGFYDTKDDKWGWFMTENYGLAALLAKHFTVNAELSFMQTFNRYDKRNDSFVTWSINGGFLF
jgi:hypothetical protein